MIDGTLFEVKQTNSESVLEYMARLNKSLANKSLDPAIRLAITLQGLRPLIRNAVVMKEPQNLDQLRHAALLCEKTLKTNSSSSEAILEAVLEKINSLETKLEENSIVNATFNGNGPLQKSTDLRHRAPWDHSQYSYTNQRSTHMHSPNYHKQRSLRPSNNYSSYQNNGNTSGLQQSQYTNHPPRAEIQPISQRTVNPNQACQGCGKSCISRNKCPAFGRQCHHCFKMNHFSSVCRSARRQ